MIRASKLSKPPARVTGIRMVSLTLRMSTVYRLLKIWVFVCHCRYRNRDLLPKPHCRIPFLKHSDAGARKVANSYPTLARCLMYMLMPHTQRTPRSSIRVPVTSQNPSTHAITRRSFGYRLLRLYRGVYQRRGQCRRANDAAGRRTSAVGSVLSATSAKSAGTSVCFATKAYRVLRTYSRIVCLAW